MESNQPINDQELVNDVLAGNTQAFNQLVTRYFNLVYLIGYARFRRRETGEDLAQETFLRAYLHLEKLSDPQLFPAWVCRIARNLATDWQRKSQRVSQLLPMIPIEDLPTETPDTKTLDARAQLETSGQNKVVQEALLKLPADLREIVLLYYSEGLNKEEIGRLLGIHPVQVGRQLKKALGILKGILEPVLRESIQPLRASQKATLKGIAIITAATILSASSKAAIISAIGDIARNTAASLSLPIERSITEVLKYPINTITKGVKFMGIKQAFVVIILTSSIIGVAINNQNSGTIQNSTNNNIEASQSIESTENKPVLNQQINNHDRNIVKPENNNKLIKNSNLITPTKPNEKLPGVIVEGYVKDKKSQMLLPEISVNINNDYPIATTDNQGYFQANIGFNQVFTIFAVGSSICSPNMTIDATGQDTIYLILETIPAGKIIGNVINESKEPIPNAKVRFVTSNLLKDISTDSQGLFAIDNIDPDIPEFHIYIYAEGYMKYEINNTKFSANKNIIALTIELSKQNTITVAGDVKDISNKFIEGAVVSYGVFDGWKQYKVTTTDINGQFRLQNIQLVTDYTPQDDNLVFYARSSGYAPAWYKLNSSQDTEIHIVLPPSHHVSGKIVDTLGNAIRESQISVMAYPAMKNIVQKDWIFNMWQHYYFPDNEGRFKIEDLPIEEIDYSFFAKGYTALHYVKLPIDRDDLVVTLQTSGVVIGKVIDDRTREPIHMFTVKIDRLKSDPKTRVYFPMGYYKPGVSFISADGYFTITELDLGQKLRVIINADGYSEQEIEPVPVLLSPLKENDKLIFRMQKSYNAK